MKFEPSYSYSSGAPVEGLAGIVQKEFADASDYYDGEIESLRAKNNRLAEIVTQIAAVLQPDQQIAVAAALGYKEVP